MKTNKKFLLPSNKSTQKTYLENKLDFVRGITDCFKTEFQNLPLKNVAVCKNFVTK